MNQDVLVAVVGEVKTPRDTAYISAKIVSIELPRTF